MKDNQPNINRDIPEIEGLSGLDFTIKSDKIVELTKRRAEEYLDLPAFAGERSPTDSHVQDLFDKMTHGLFVDHHVIIATCRCKEPVLAGDNKTLLPPGTLLKLNGQHTCWARFDMPESYKCRVRWIEYEVKTAEDLKSLYGVFDRNKTRSAGHVLKVKLLGTDASDGVSPGVLNALTSGIKMWLFEKHHDRQRAGADQVAAMIQSTHTELFNVVGKFLQQHPTQKHVKQAAVVGAMFATFDKVPTIAPEFWNVVATGVGIESQNDARYQLRELLKNVAVAAKGVTVTGKRRVINREELYRICVQAWNKWRKKEKVQNLRGTNTRVRPL